MAQNCAAAGLVSNPSEPSSEPPPRSFEDAYLSAKEKAEMEEEDALEDKLKQRPTKKNEKERLDLDLSGSGH